METQKTDKPQKSKLTVQQIEDGVLQMIRQGLFRPGKPIREVELCKQFNVSRTPVREALRLLQNNGVVEYTPNRGVQVVDLSEQDLTYITDTRRVLEVLSAREAALRITQEEAENLRKINSCFHEEGMQGQYWKDDDFHISIARISGNPCLIAYISNLLVRQAMLASTIPMTQQRLPYSYEEHEAIIRALELHDPELAAKQTDIHFYMSQKSLQDKLRRYHKEKTSR